jgi:hypothetical protein
MTITKKIVLNEQGDPTDVLIPYEQFMELSTLYGWDQDEPESQKTKDDAFCKAVDKVFDHHAPLLKKLSQ